MVIVLSIVSIELIVKNNTVVSVAISNCINYNVETGRNNLSQMNLKIAEKYKSNDCQV